MNDWIANNKDHIRKYAKAYCAKPEVISRRKRTMKKWRKKHWKREHRKNVIYVHQRYLTDPIYRLRMQLRNRLNNAIRREQKAGSAISDLGCTIQELKQYLEKQFLPGMTWKNHSRYGWNIHHKRALETFDLTNREQFKQAVHYTNLQPVWFADHNLIHGKRNFWK